MSIVFVFSICCILIGVQGGEECNGVLKGKHIEDDVEVGKMGCTLMRTYANGEVKSGSESGGTLSLRSSTVDGIVVKQSSGIISIDKSVIKPNGLKLHDCASTLKICGATVAEVIEFMGCTGDFLLKNDRGCAVNEIYKDVKIKEIKGNVEIMGNKSKEKAQL